MTDMLDRALRGAIAGFIATLPMTVFMKSFHKQLPREQQYPLPPRLITENLAERVGLGEVVETEAVAASMTLANHFLYGAAAGTVYGLTMDRASESFAEAIERGSVFGLMVWGASYLGFLPATDTLPSATKAPKERNLLMISAHVVWGSALGAASCLLENIEKPLKR